MKTITPVLSDGYPDGHLTMRISNNNNNNNNNNIVVMFRSSEPSLVESETYKLVREMDEEQHRIDSS